MPNTCICCGHGKRKGEKVSMFRLPSLRLAEDEVTDQTRVCSRHFLHGDPANIPSFDLGKSFASPKKSATERSKRATKRSIRSPLFSTRKRACSTPSRTPSSRASSVSAPGSACSPTTTGDEMMSEDPVFSDSSMGGASSVRSDSSMVLAARIELLEAETRYLRSKTCAPTKPQLFRVEVIASNDSLVQFYTGFASYQSFLNFFEFLGDAVYRLNYWGDSEKKTSRRRKNMPLNPLNQCFLTLIKLRLNLRVKDLACRFGISTGLVSKYFTTWICFLYHYLKEIDWTPAVEQVAATLPCPFLEKYPTTYSIIDASEIFLQTPSDLFMQSSTWSSYKHHNTAKVLVGCTPNDAVSYVSKLYVGSVSDVELTKVSGYLDTLNGKAGVSVMADRGFTVRDLLAVKNVALNIPPFMEGRQQLSPQDVQSGRNIASLRIHVERVIGRIKNFSILKSTLPISMIRIVNQIVSVCAWLTNFQPVLIPLPSSVGTEEEVDTYFKNMEDDSDYDADSEMSDECL